MMACSAAGRDIIYFTFGDKKLRDTLHEIHNFLESKSITIAQLWHYLCRFYEAGIPPKQLYPFIQKTHSEDPYLVDEDNESQSVEETNEGTPTSSRARDKRSGSEKKADKAKRKKK